MSGKTRSRVLRWLKFFGIIIPISGGLVYLLWFSPVFMIQKIEAKGAAMSADEVSSLLGDNIIGSNIIFWQPQNKQTLNPRFSEIKINKKYFSRAVEIVAADRQKKIIWCFEADNSCYWVDDSGFIFSPAPSSSSEIIRLVSDFRETPLGIGSHVLPGEMVANLNSILDILSRLKISVDAIRLEKIKLRELVVIPRSGPRIIFSLDFNPDFTETALSSLMKSTSWNQIKSLNLTVSGRAYPSF